MNKSKSPGGRKPPARFKNINPGFFQAASSQQDPVSDAILRQARHSGQLNLSNRSLSEVPEKVWRINEPPADEAGACSFEAQGDKRWWDQTELTRLNLSSNELVTLSEELKLLSALQALDVSLSVGDVNFVSKGTPHWLQIQYNRVTGLPRAVGTLVNLTKLLLR